MKAPSCVKKISFSYEGCASSPFQGEGGRGIDTIFKTSPLPLLAKEGLSDLTDFS